MSHMPGTGRPLVEQVLRVITPTALASGSTNNYNPVDAVTATSFLEAEVVRQATNAGGSTISGLVAQADGHFVNIVNLGPGTLTITDEDVTSSAANRFALASNATTVLAVDAVASFIYDATSARWRSVVANAAGALTGVISPTAITGLTNDWNPTGQATSARIRINTSGAVDLTGLANGFDGRELELVNIGANTVTIYSDNINSSAANRFTLPGGNLWPLTSTSSALFRYDGTTQRWRMSSWASTNYPAIATVGDLSVGATATVVGNLGVNGNATLGDASTDAHILNGNLTFGNSPAAGAVKYGSLNGRIFLGRQVFSSSGTYTPSTGTKAVRVRMVGAGGGGGGAGGGANRAVGSGGGSGVYWEKWIDPAATVTGGAVTIGAAGSAGANTGGNGGNGGDTSVVVQATTYTAKGGTGGAGSVSGTLATPTPGAPQSGSTAGADVTSGDSGDVGLNYNAGGFQWSGNGGASAMGIAGAGVFNTQAAGGAASGFGAGGGGGSATASGFAGGGGAGGCVIFEEFF